MVISDVIAQLTRVKEAYGDISVVCPVPGTGARVAYPDVIRTVEVTEYNKPTMVAVLTNKNK